MRAVTAGILVLLPIACAGLRIQERVERIAHPCSELTASWALDTASITYEETPGRLVLGAFDVAGRPVRGGAAQLKHVGPIPAGHLLGRPFNDTGVVVFDSVPPGDYEIELQPFPYERLVQSFRILPGRTDTLCYVVRTNRTPPNFGRPLENEASGRNEAARDRRMQGSMLERDR